MEQATVPTIKFNGTKSIPAWAIYIFGYLMMNMMLARSKGFQWMKHDDGFDYIVGISIDGEPVCSGVILNEQLVITAANPIERVTNVDSVKVHAINGNYKREKMFDVFAIARDQARRNTQFWKPFGFDNRHSPIHDILILTLTLNITDPKGGYGYRCPRSTPFKQIDYRNLKGHFSFAGFGFVDKVHVRDASIMAAYTYQVEDVIENCDEWIPRVWGNFICFNNINNFVGISSGAALFYNGLFFAIGSFAVSKGNDSVLIFTDLRPYWNYYFINRTYHKMYEEYFYYG